VLDAMPGATSELMTAGRSARPQAWLYKVGGKMFAILSARADQHVILKCDPHLIEILKEQYAGVGHRTHLDRRFWIAVALDADVPAAEIERLAARSYDSVRASLTRKQQAELAARWP
jgi:predicted DNA-binding protein (MmcQ/YjbR family)